MRGAFVYSPLRAEQKEIRLLTLEPSSAASPGMLCCSLTTVSLSSPQDYETISYRWGDSNTRSVIKLGQHEFDVPRSSERALRRMQLADMPRVLWLDAICIDQENIVERSEQVVLMPEIYKTGRRNLIFLGEGNPHTRSALWSIRLLMNTEIAEAIRSDRSLLETTRDSSGTYIISSQPLTTAVDQEALASLYSQPWFSRLWIIQEVVQAPRSICHWGDEQIEMFSVGMVASWLMHKAYHLEPALLETQCFYPAAHMFDYLRSKHSLFGSGRKSLDWDRVLIRTPDRLCLDPRDKVFASLGFINWPSTGPLPDSLTPDYSLPMHVVYTRAARYCFAQSQTPGQLLHWVRHRSNEELQVDGLPSWVPRWHRQQDLNVDVRFMSFGLSPSQGLEPAPAVPDDQNSPHLLALFGYELDTVESVSPPCSDTDDMATFQKSFVDPMAEVTSSTAIRDVCRTITAGSWYDFQPLTEQQIILLQQFMHERDLPTTTSTESTVSLTQSLDASTAEDCWRSIKFACFRRILCQTKRHKLSCLVLDITRPGDVIVQFPGAFTPYVLRPNADDDDAYLYIGEAYVCGMMDGEIAGDVDRGRLKLQSFVLA